MKIASFDAFRYFLALCVLIGHAYIVLFRAVDSGKVLLVCQNIAVDGFFILSGLLLAKSCISLMSTGNESPAKIFLLLTCKRAKRLWSEYFFAIVITFVLSNLFAQKIKLAALPFNLFFISQVNTVPGIVNGSWYVCVLFWVGCVLSALLIHKRETASFVLIPAIGICSFGFLFPSFGSLSLNWKPLVAGVWSAGFINGFMDISLGMSLYFFAEYLRSNPFRIRKVMVKPILIVVEILGIFLIAYAMTRTKVARTDYLALFGFSMIIPLFYLQKETLLKFLSMGGAGKKFPVALTCCS